MPSFYEKNGYDVEVYIGPLKIDSTIPGGSYGLCDNLNINASENQSRTLTFSFIPPRTTINPEQFQGAAIVVNFRTSAGWAQVFSGYADTPSIDFFTRKITLECSDQRNNRIIKLPYSEITKIGSYSDDVFGTPKDNSEELDRRLQTVAASYDFDSYGNPYLTPWLPKAIPDYIFTSEKVFHDESGSQNPKVAYTNHDKTINTINIEVTYTYQRLHQQSCSFSWPGYADFLSDWYNAGKPSFPAIEAINSAATSTDWKLISEINYTFLWSAQGFGGILWQPNQVTYQYKGREQIAGYAKDSSGNFITVGSPGPTRLVPVFEPVLDENNKQIMDVIGSTVTDTSSNLCRGVSWTSALRFSQTVKEKYNITMTAPQSTSRYGIITGNERVAIEDPYDVSIWEKSDLRTFTNENFYINRKDNYTKLQKALQVSLNKARHDILALHRDAQVTFRTKSLYPAIDLKHTAQIDVDRSVIASDTMSLNAIGKISSISHVLNFNTREAYTNVTISLSRSQGTTTDSPFRVTVPVEDPSYIRSTVKSITLGTHLGIDPNVDSNSDKWTGWIANKYITTVTGNDVVTNKTNYPEKFVVDFPKIPDNVRNEITYESNTELNVFIPNNTLETSF